MCTNSSLRNGMNPGYRGYLTGRSSSCSSDFVALGDSKLWRCKLKRFVRRNSKNTIDFGAASAQIGKVFDPEIYSLRIDAAHVIENENTLVVLELIEAHSGAHVKIQPIWIDGPNANTGRLAAENQDLIAQLLTLARQPTAGDVDELIPKLIGLTFEARLVLSTDRRTGRTFNSLAEILKGDKS
jgi:hypothetical protein